MTPPEEEKQGWRHIRLQQSGKNASGQTHYLSLSGLELYGSVIGVCDELGKAAKEAEQQLRRQRRLMRTHVLKHLVIGKCDFSNKGLFLSFTCAQTTPVTWPPILCCIL